MASKNLTAKLDIDFETGEDGFYYPSGTDAKESVKKVGYDALYITPYGRVKAWPVKSPPKLILNLIEIEFAESAGGVYLVCQLDEFRKNQVLGKNINETAGVLDIEREISSFQNRGRTAYRAKLIDMNDMIIVGSGNKRRKEPSTIAMLTKSFKTETEADEALTRFMDAITQKHGRKLWLN